MLHAVREVWAGVLAVRLSVTDWHPRGNSVAAGVATARAMAEGGADLIHVEAGQTVHDDRPEYRRGFLTALSDRVRNEARVPTLVGGHLTTIDDANTAVAAGEPTSSSSTCRRPTSSALSRQVTSCYKPRSPADHARFGSK